MRVARALVDGVASWVGWIPSADAGAWHPIADPYEAFALGADPAPIGDALDAPTLLPPCEPLVVAGIAQNRGQNDHPLPVQAWLKSPRTVVADGTPVALRRDAGGTVVEAEVAVVIGSPLFQVPVDEVLRHVLGYTAVNDVSQPERSALDQRNFEAKGGVGYTPLGPWIETGPIGDVPMTMRVAGEVVVDTSSDALPASIAEVVAYVAHWMPLGPGDVVMTGAPFSNAPAAPGDLVEVGIGTMTLTTPLR
ncbi:fumarylacetoacetate hydrolase family protein [Agrococcus versicolor]|uniref:Fumarylacetoacetate hydrolase family protein n=1 Tax=Agrococcus versicolor TaxID=501482 RepID=A0ABP5MD20_9MICO